MLMRSIKSMIQRDRRRYRRPRTLRDVIPVEHVWEDGIFQLGNKFSKSIRLKDVNYKAAGLDKRTQIIENYCALLDGIEPGVMVKLTVNNRSHSREALEKAVRMPMKNSGSDKYREEINGIIMDSFDKYEGRIKETYLTVSVFADDIAQAREDFKRIFDVIHAHLLELGSGDTPLDASERLSILRDFYRKGEEDKKIEFTGDGILPAEVLPQRMERKPDHLIIDGRYARVFYVKEIGNSLYEGLVHRLVSKKMDMMYSIDFMAVPKSEAGRFAERTVLGVETNLSNWQRRQNRSMNYTADIPYQMQKQRTAAKEFLHSIVSEDQTMFYTLMTLVLRADTKAQLDKDTKTLLSTGQDCGLEIATMRYQQMDGLNAVLPMGERKINVFRTLNTSSLAAFLPFWMEDIIDPGGMYYGVNQETGNPILIDRKKLLNQSGICFGVPGSGKSVFAKFAILLAMLNTNDHIIITDPEGEYARVVEAMGDIGSVIRISAGGKDRLNAMEMTNVGNKKENRILKSKFIMSLIDQFSDNTVGPKHKSVIDRALRNIYDNPRKGRKPTLTTLREELLKFSEPEAQEVALLLELYTVGSLNIFGGQTNVDLSKRVIVFDIHDLDEHLKPAGLLVITDTILNRVNQNCKNGIRTHVFIDEFHVVLSNPHSAAFFDSAWKQMRKRNAYPTAITQNVDYLMQTAQGRSMLSNSEFVVMFNQAEQDQEVLARLMKLSPEQMHYVKNANAGSGLIKCGRSTIPFDNRIPSNLEIYKLMNTTAGEWAA